MSPTRSPNCPVTVVLFVDSKEGGRMRVASLKVPHFLGRAVETSREGRCQKFFRKRRPLPGRGRGLSRSAEARLHAHFGLL